MYALKEGPRMQKELAAWKKSEDIRTSNVKIALIIIKTNEKLSMDSGFKACLHSVVL